MIIACLNNFQLSVFFTSKENFDKTKNVFSNHFQEYIFFLLISFQNFLSIMPKKMVTLKLHNSLVKNKVILFSKMPEIFSYGKPENPVTY